MSILRDDIDPAKTWVISDTHFGHKNIIEFCHRPADHDQLMLENIAREVPDDPEITLLHLGDLCYRGNALFKHTIAPHIAPLTGRKLLVKGNHDGSTYGFYKKCGFKLARPFSIMWGDVEVSFSHYPWNVEGDSGLGVPADGPMPEKHLRVHGHIHNTGYTRSGFVPFLRQHVNVSVEQTKYKPVNLALLLAGVLDGRVAAGEPRQGLEDQEKGSHHV